MSDFHFLQPLWFLALLPLLFLFWKLYTRKTNSNSWSQVIDAHLLPLLLKGTQSKTSKLAFSILAIAWLLTITALADPVWEKIPRPVFQTNAARVIVLDLSRSMLTADLKPSRLARARFKVEDILSPLFLKREEGQTGLVVFAGDAFTAAPLTRDVDTIRSLLKVLTPQIMPSQGSRADLGLLKAQELLKQAGITSGEVLLIADGVVGKLAEQAASQLEQNGFSVSVLGVGTEEGGIIPNLTLQNGEFVTTKLQSSALQAIARQGGGQYRQISSSNDDLVSLLTTLQGDSLDETPSLQNENLASQDWKSTGPFIILCLLPLAALAFRRGWLFNLALLIGLSSIVLQPQPVMAFSLDQAWDSLWQRPDQQADKALKTEQYEKASEIASDPQRLGSAEYKQGKYQQALENFSKSENADASYNRGNALAKLEKFKEAIAAYDEALKKQPDMQDAIINKKAIEELLKQQENQQHDKPEQDKNKENQQQDNQGSSGNKEDANSTEQHNQNSEDKSEEKKQKGEKNSTDEKQEDGNREKEQQDNPSSSENQFSDAAKKLDQEQKDKASDKDNHPKDNNAEKNEQDSEQESSDPQHQDNQQQNNQKQAEAANTLETQEGTKAEATELTNEEKMAAEQWLRRIPDDPGGLLRRKFINQYQQRNIRRYNQQDRSNRVNDEPKPW